MQVADRAEVSVSIPVEEQEAARQGLEHGIKLGGVAVAAGIPQQPGQAEVRAQVFPHVGVQLQFLELQDEDAYALAFRLRGALRGFRDDQFFDAAPGLDNLDLARVIDAGNEDAFTRRNVDPIIG